MRHRLGLATKTQISVCKSPFPSAGTAVSLFRAKTAQQRPLLPREIATRLPDCGVTHYVRIDQNTTRDLGYTQPILISVLSNDPVTLSDLAKYIQ